MILEYGAETGLLLIEPEDFQRLKIVAKIAPGAGLPDVPGIVFTDQTNALISTDVIPRLAGEIANAEWLDRYRKMLEAAAKHGWIDAATGSIKAHVSTQ